MDMGVHCIDLMEYISGMWVTEVAAMQENIAFRKYSEYTVEDTSSVLMRMENGAQFIVQTNFNIPDEASKWRLEFFGTRGRLMGDTVIGQNDGGKLNMFCLEENLPYNSRQDHKENVGIDVEADFGNMYTREIESFSNSILNQKPFESPAEQAVHVQKIVELAYRSGEEKKIFDVI